MNQCKYMNNNHLYFGTFLTLSLAYHANPNHMKSKSTLLTLALATALVVTGTNRVIAQEVAQTSNTPALMLGFTGTTEGSVADLQWVMENETNSKWFVIERSGADGGFDSIAVVLGINNGNETTYSFSDPNMLPGCNSYRLREVDMDNIQRYSKVIALMNNNQSASAKMDVYPNPAIATINYSVTSAAAQQVLVQVYNLAGVMLAATQQELQAGNNLQTVAIGNLRSGNYILKVSSQSGSFQYVQSFVKIN
jgi:hypothetical protein